MSCKLLLLTFFITSSFDVLLQLSRKYNIPFINFFVGDSDWFISLTKDGGYFDRHTPLAAALLAGLAGFVAQYLILKILPFPSEMSQAPKFLLVTFVVSALVGLLMNDAWPTSLKIFPVLSQTYYKDLGKLRSMVTDGCSGIIVNTTILLISFFLEK